MSDQNDIDEIEQLEAQVVELTEENERLREAWIPFVDDDRPDIRRAARAAFGADKDAYVDWLRHGRT